MRYNECGRVDGRTCHLNEGGCNVKDRHRYRYEVLTGLRCPKCEYEPEAAFEAVHFIRYSPAVDGRNEGFVVSCAKCGHQLFVLLGEFL